LRSLIINVARVNAISVTGNGTLVPISSFPASVRTSEQGSINTYDNTSPSASTDLTIYMQGDTYGLATGLLGGVTVEGNDRLGNVFAYDVRDSRFSFSVGTGAIKINHDVDDTL